MNMKRFIDIIFSFIFLMLCLPVFLVISLLILFMQGKPIIFSQERPGLNAKVFLMYKFCTMNNKRDGSGNLLPDDSRLTILGRFLRATSLDELPELWNVLKGEMSLVGPRPLLIEYLALYSDSQKRRHDVRPGITGWAQVNGRNAISWEDKFNLDLWYVQNQSFWLDVRILLMTIKKVIVREGVSADNHATMPKFTGNAKQDTK